MSVSVGGKVLAVLINAVEGTMSLPSFPHVGQKDRSICFNTSAYRHTFRMTICDNPATKPCPSDVCQRDEHTREVVESLDRVVWFIAFRPVPVMYVNPAFTLLSGLEREELYANPGLWNSHIHPEDRLRVRSAFTLWVSSAAHESYEIEYRIIDKDQCIHKVRDVVSGLFDREGTWCGSTGIVEDHGTEGLWHTPG